VAGWDDTTGWPSCAGHAWVRGQLPRPLPPAWRAALAAAVTGALNPHRHPVAATVRALPGDDGRRGAAAVHVQHASVDERGLVAGEVDRGVRDGLRVSETTRPRIERNQATASAPSEERLNGPPVLLFADRTELVVHVLSPAIGFASHLFRHISDEHNEAVDAGCYQGHDDDVLPPHCDHQPPSSAIQPSPAYGDRSWHTQIIQIGMAAVMT